MSLHICIDMIERRCTVPPAAALSPERVRDEGGHCLVVVDDIRPLSDVWEQLLAGLAGGWSGRVVGGREGV